MADESPERGEKQPDEEVKEEEHIESFPNGKKSLDFGEFLEIIKSTCNDEEQAENYLLHAFSMFD